MARRSPLFMAAAAVGIALAVAGIWVARGKGEAVSVPRAEVATVAVKVTRHDRVGMPAFTATVRERERVFGLVAALGVDEQPAAECPADYASADYGLVLSGTDVYARRNVYVWLEQPERVVVVTSAGCRGGPPANPSELRALLNHAVRRDASL